MSTDTGGSASPSLYKYVPIENLRYILDGAIRFTQPGAFNDPFELLPELVMRPDEPERKLNVNFDIMAQRRDTSADDVDEIPEGFGCTDATSRNFVHLLNERIGILSLSKIPDSLLMWSHYADQYAGAVVEFDGSHAFFEGQIDVEYRPRRPRKHLNYYLGDAAIPVAELCVKSDQWAYEQEVRLVRALSECREVGKDPRAFPVFVRAVPAAAIKSVTLGERTDVKVQREMFSRVMDTNIVLALAAIADTGFGFRREIVKYGVPLSQMGPMISPRTAHIFAELPSQLGELSRWAIEHHPHSKIVNLPV